MTVPQLGPFEPGVEVWRQPAGRAFGRRDRAPVANGYSCRRWFQSSPHTLRVRMQTLLRPIFLAYPDQLPVLEDRRKEVKLSGSPRISAFVIRLL